MQRMFSFTFFFQIENIIKLKICFFIFVRVLCAVLIPLIYITKYKVGKINFD